MSASESVSRGGQPSTTTPTAPPCDSPQVVMRNRCPKVLPIRWRPSLQRLSYDISGGAYAVVRGVSSMGADVQGIALAALLMLLEGSRKSQKLRHVPILSQPRRSEVST